MAFGGGPKPGEPVVGWCDLGFAVMTPGWKEKQVLTSLTGFARAGKVLGVLGPSGSGKSTFLSLLAGQLGCGRITSGEVRSAIDGQEDSDMLMYLVPQEDCLQAHLTVRELLTYSARLQLPRARPKVIAARVEATIDAVGLTKVARSRIGGVAGTSGGAPRGISGGERKRLAIAGALLSERPVLLLDEPTSGLDATTAAKILALCSDIAARHACAVVLTVHQPRRSAFEQLDDVLLLSHGRTVYFGARGEALSDYLQFHLLLPPELVVSSNRANLLLDLVENYETGASTAVETADSAALEEPDSPGSQERTMLAANRTSESSDFEEESGPLDFGSEASADASFVDRDGPMLRRSSSFDTNKHLLATGTFPRADLVAAHESSAGHAAALKVAGDLPHVWTPGSNESTFSLRSAKILAARSMRADLWSDPTWLVTMIAHSNIVLLVVGTLFWHVPSTLGGVSIAAAALLLVLTFGASFTWHRTERAVQMITTFQAEHANGLYAPASLALARTVYDELITAVAHVPPYLYYYWLVGLRASTSAYLTFIFVIWVSMSTFNLWTVTLAFVSGRDWLATLINTSLLGAWTLTAGFLVTSSQIPVWWRWLNYVNPVRYAGHALVLNQYADMGPVSDCLDSQRVPALVDGTLVRACPDGLQIVTALGMKRTVLWNVGIVVAINLVSRAVFFAALAMRGYVTSSNRHTMATAAATARRKTSEGLTETSGSSPGPRNDDVERALPPRGSQPVATKTARRPGALTRALTRMLPTSQAAFLLLGILKLAIVVAFSAYFFREVAPEESPKYGWATGTKSSYPALYGYVEASTLTVDDVLEYDRYRVEVVAPHVKLWNTLFPRVEPPIYRAENDSLGPDKELGSFQELFQVFPRGYDIGPQDPGAQMKWFMNDTGDGALLLRIMQMSGDDQCFSRLTTLPPVDSFPVATSTGVQVFLQQTLRTTWGNAPTTLEQALSAGRLYMANYWFLENVEHDIGYTTHAPKILFYLLDSGELVTVAIQLGQNPRQAPLITAYDDARATGNPWNWWYARVCARHAITMSANFYHVATLHWPVETVRVALNRALSESHPVRALLYPFMGYASVLNTATRVPGALPLKLTGQGQATLVSNILGNTSFVDSYDYVASLERRGLTAPAAGAPDFAEVSEMRDLLIALWGVQDDFAAAFVNATYAEDADVEADAPLQDFVTELSHPDRGNFGNLTRSGQVATRGDLAGVLTRLLHRRVIHGAAGPVWQAQAIVYPTTYVPVLRAAPLLGRMQESTLLNAFGTRLDVVEFLDFFFFALAPAPKPMAAWQGGDFFPGGSALSALVDEYIGNTTAALRAHDRNGTWNIAATWGGLTAG
ncbi:ATP-binding cassette (ABC) superfamily protein [Klebsormidium nitens]|uniref:ATP-binding cassette (ABC) superfamily protein n=1 Tax=Klebsormidium nitens TaxID=105231 RepID=A0A1Y1I518_KLENI|nr:ATP-binding cassette (ABC) superfamily protein [Klebsormidium nitens]|eukprot:GAQ83218.1 ATP-binding cassette (ABC) superfamily protein [Klebsormidium nitens]